jgi:SAM-dependent methyltransferase
MSVPDRYSFIRYLEAKRAIDDVALNRHVLEHLAEILKKLQGRGTVTVLEVGCGIGTMVERMLDSGLLTRAVYTGIDFDPDTVAEAKKRLRGYADRKGFETMEQPDGPLRLRRQGAEFILKLVASDLFDFVGSEGENRGYDLIVAHAFLDLVDLDSALRLLFSAARPEGFLYFALNFDGATIFEPQIDPILDEQIETLYHQDMDLRGGGGTLSQMSRTGRRLLAYLSRAGATILASGGSDWIVYPGPEGYSPDEVYFLHFIIETVRAALESRPGLEQTAFSAWIAERHNQVAQRELIYIAHQLDVLAQVPNQGLRRCGR